MFHQFTKAIYKTLIGVLFLYPSFSMASRCDEGVVEKRLAATPMVQGVIDLFVQSHKDTQGCNLHLINSFKEIEAPEPGPGYIAVYSCSRKKLPVFHAITVTGLCESAEPETLELDIQKIEFGGLD